METPQMMAASYASTSLPLDQMMLANPNVAPFGQRRVQIDNGLQAQFDAIIKPAQPNKEIIVMANTRRLIQVFIADPNDNVPLDKCLIYSGDQKLTDLTDQELFFEVDIKSLLDKHNAERVKLVNKAVKERTEYLEPARIRDLKMTVVTIAQF